MRLSAALVGTIAGVVLGSTIARADDEGTQREFHHAEWLENQGEFYRSASSYLRVLDSASASGLRENAAVGLVRVHRMGEQWKETVFWGEHVRSLVDLGAESGFRVSLEAAHALIKLDRSGDALRELSQIDEQYLGQRDGCRSFRLRCYALLLERDVPAARRLWSQEAIEYGCSSDGPLSLALDEVGRIRPRSRFAAGFLGLVPGVGYLATGQKQTALATLIVNGLLIGGAVEAFQNDLNFLGSTFTVFALGWYSGSIYGSVTSVNRQYEAQWARTLESVDLDTY